jgi:hypothetical protein
MSYQFLKNMYFKRSYPSSEDLTTSLMREPQNILGPFLLIILQPSQPAFREQHPKNYTVVALLAPETSGRSSSSSICAPFYT